MQKEPQNWVQIEISLKAHPTIWIARNARNNNNDPQKSTIETKFPQLSSKAPSPCIKMYIALNVIVYIDF